MIEKYIKALLFEFDCVTLPAYGSFVCTYQEAEISIAKNKITPPRKNIAFNYFITHNNPQLGNYIAEKEQITFEESKVLIEKYIAKIELELTAHSQYTIEGLGRFYKNDKGLTFFEQNTRFNFLKDSYGLPDLYFKPINRTVKENNINKHIISKTMVTTNNNDNNLDDENYDAENELEEVDFNDYEEDQETKKTSNLAGYYILAILALMFTAGTAYYLNMDKQTYAIGSFNPMSMFGRNDVSAEIDNKLLPENTEEGSSNNYSSEEEQNTSEEVSTESTEAVEQPTYESPKPRATEVVIDNIIESKTGKYFVIIGGFKNKRKAAAFVSKLISEGNEAKVIAPYDDKGVYRVSVADYNSYEEASSGKSTLAQNYGSDLWILNY